ncbi:MAG: DUF1684 domain-containing protein [Actinoplanes sp.]
MTVDQIEPSVYEQQWAAWHRQHEKNLADPHGFLAITGLHWLEATPRRFDDAPGAWSTGPRGVTVTLGEDESLLVDGVTVRGTHHFGIIPERGGVNAAFGDAVVEVAKRGGFDIIRPRHPEHPLRAAFTGVPSYPPSPGWVLEGRYVPFAEPRAVTVGAAVEGLQHVYESPGRVDFEHRGTRLSLTAFNGRVPGSLFILFTDATSGVTTYAANRTLSVDAPAEDGTVVLDFNRAVNLVCAYTDFATCPLPPAENKLPIAVEAGEQIPYERR